MLQRKSASGVAKASLQPRAARRRATQQADLEVIEPPTLVRNGRFNLTVHDSAIASRNDSYSLNVDITGAQGTSHTSGWDGARAAYTGERGPEPARFESAVALPHRPTRAGVAATRHCAGQQRAPEGLTHGSEGALSQRASVHRFEWTT